MKFTYYNTYLAKRPTWVPTRKTTKGCCLFFILLLYGIPYSFAQEVISTCAVELGESQEICTGQSIILTPEFMPSVTCSTMSLNTVNNSTNGLVDFNNANLQIGNATVMAVRSFSGTTRLDEDVINNSQTTGIIGIRQGLQNSNNSSDAMTNTYTFSQKVCDLTMTVWDIDRTDGLVITAYNNNTPIAYTITNLGSCVSRSGNTFSSVCNAQVSGDAAHKFDITFNSCVDRIEYRFYNFNGSNNAGGSYTVTWGNGCTKGGNNQLVDCLKKLNNSFNGLSDFNNANIKIRNATLTGVRTFRGGAIVDEDVINNSQTTGIIGIRQGVQRSNNSSDAMLHTYTLSEEVCDVTFTVWDIDRTDELIVNAFNNGVAIPFTITNRGACVSQSGNTFTASCDVQINTDATHKFDITFNGCIDQIDFQFYNFNGANNAGGSYTLTWGEDCINFSDPACPLVYQWSGPGIINGTTTPVLTASEPGIYSVTVTDCTGCSATDQITVSVPTQDLTCEYRLQKQVDWTSGDCNPTICSGGRLALSVAPNNFASYQWEGPNGFSGTGNANGDILVSNCLMPAQAGIYAVTITNENGCTATSSINIKTKECPCTLNTEVHDKIYQENNSNNPSDHTFSFKTTINGSGENGWLLYDMANGNFNQILQTGNNDTTLDFGPIPVDGDGLLIVIMDTDNTTCFQSIGVNMSSCLYTGACSCCK